MRSLALGTRGVVLVFLGLVLPSRAAVPSPAPSERLFSTQHIAMATTWQLYLYADNAETAQARSEEAFDEIDRIECLLSNYKPQSELSRINQEAAAHSVTTDPETFSFLTAAQAWSRRSGGAFDMTVGPLMKAWGFYRKQGSVPSQATLEALRPRVGWQHVTLAANGRTLRFDTPGVELDPGGIGKGFAVDAVLRLLRAAGVQRAMISAGSSTLGAIGAPPGKDGWPVISHDPWHPSREVTTAMLRDETLSTANCAEKNFTLGGHLYCHIMNTRTLRPVEGMLQVTIIHPSGTASDALSNALFVLPPQQSAVLLALEPQARSLIVTGRQDHRICTAIRWHVPIAAGFCERIEEVR